MHKIIITVTVSSTKGSQKRLHAWQICMWNRQYIHTYYTLCWSVFKINVFCKLYLFLIELSTRHKTFIEIAYDLEVQWSQILWADMPHCASLVQFCRPSYILNHHESSPAEGWLAPSFLKLICADVYTCACVHVCSCLHVCVCFRGY